MLKIKTYFIHKYDLCRDLFYLSKSKECKKVMWDIQKEQGKDFGFQNSSHYRRRQETEKTDLVVKSIGNVEIYVQFISFLLKHFTIKSSQIKKFDRYSSSSSYAEIFSEMLLHNPGLLGFKWKLITWGFENWPYFSQ